MRLAGLVTEKQYQGMLARLEAQLDGLPASAAVPQVQPLAPPVQPVEPQAQPSAPPTAAQPSPFPTYPPRKLGIDEHVTYSADPAADSMWSFAIDSKLTGQWYSGYTLTCATIRYRAVSTPLTAGGAVVQSPDLDPYGNLLAPGRYSSVTESGLHMSCILTSLGRTQIAVDGNNGEQTKVFGVPLDGGGAAA